MQPRESGDPDRIASYRVIGRLGAGGMGVVYLAQTERGTPVAVKTLLTGGDPSFAARFQREVEAALLVSSPYTARVIDADTRAEQPYLVTEYVAGETLRDYVDRVGPMSQQQVEATAMGLAAGLEAIHRMGVTHRDLSAANVMLTGEGPRIIDLGVASVEDATRLTQTGTAMGTPAFMAPEHARGEVVGPPSDIFAWGSLTAFAANGSPPFGSGRAEQVLYRIVHEQPAIEGLPAALQDPVRRALAKQPAQRPDAGDLVGELARSLSTQTRSATDGTTSVTALITDRWQAATAPIRPGTATVDARANSWSTAATSDPDTQTLSAESDPSEPTEAVATSRPRRRWPIVAAFTAAALTLAAGTYALLPDPETPLEDQAAEPDRAASDSESSEDSDDASASSTVESEQEAVDEDDEPSEPEPEPEPESELDPEPDSEESPTPDPPGDPGPLPAPWDTAPVEPEGHLREVADRYYNSAEPGWSGCKLYAPTELESGMDAEPAFWSPIWTRVGSFEFAWESTTGHPVTFVAIWPSDSRSVSRFFDEDPEGTTYADGSVLRRGGEFGESLLAIPGQDCFYELRPESMVAIDWTFESLRPISAP